MLRVVIETHEYVFLKYVCIHIIIAIEGNYKKYYNVKTQLCVLINLKFLFNMKSLVNKTKKSDTKVAQCCAKNSKNVMGCHD